MTTASEQAYSQAKAHNKAWSIPINVIDPTGADDHFAYVKNDGPNDLVIHRVNIESTVVGTVEVNAVTGTSSALTAATAVNKTANSAPAPDTTHGTGVDLTGLTVVGVLDYIAIEAVSKDVRVEYPEGIRLKTGQAVSLLWDTATGILTGNIHLYEDVP